MVYSLWIFKETPITEDNTNIFCELYVIFAPFAIQKYFDNDMFM